MSRTWLGVGIALVAAGCVPNLPEPVVEKEPDPEMEMEPEEQPPPEKPERLLRSLVIRAPSSELWLGASLALTVEGTFDDETVEDLTDRATWRSSSPEVATVEHEAGSAVVEGIAEGAATIEAEYEEVAAAISLTVVAPPAESLALSPQQLTLERAQTQQLTATLRFADGSEEDVTARASFTSSDPGVATVNTAGVVKGIDVGEATLLASFDGRTAMATVAVECDYPAGNAIMFPGTMPELSWPMARDQQGSAFDFSLRDVHCSSDWANVDALIFIISAGWCVGCPEYMRQVDPMVPDIEAAGGRIVFVEVQTTNFAPANSADASAWLSGVVGDGFGIRVGDADSQPITSAFLNTPFIQFYPNSFVVRTRDMSVITHQSVFGQTIPPFVDIAQNPELDWSTPNPVQTNCGPNDEESSEPNNTRSQASTLSIGTFSGGLCDQNPDVFRVSLAGNWRVRIEFMHSVGDLDMWLASPTTGQALLGPDGSYVLSATANNFEQIDWQGPSEVLVVVAGYNQTSAPSAPYQFTLEPR